MISLTQLHKGGIYRNDNGRRKIVAILPDNRIRYKLLSKNSRGPGKVGSLHECDLYVFAKWVKVVESLGMPVDWKRNKKRQMEQSLSTNRKLRRSAGA